MSNPNKDSTDEVVEEKGPLKIAGENAEQNGTSLGQALSSQSTAKVVVEDGIPFAEENPEHQPDLNLLPNEIVTLILKNLFLQEALPHRYVCRQWKDVIEELCRNKQILTLFILDPDTAVVPYLKAYIATAHNYNDKFMRFHSSQCSDDLIIRRRHFTIPFCNFLRRLFKPTKLIYSSDSIEPKTLHFLLKKWRRYLTSLYLHNEADVNCAIYEVLRKMKRLEVFKLIRNNVDKPDWPLQMHLWEGFDQTFPVDSLRLNIDADMGNSSLLLTILALTSRNRQQQCKMVISDNYINEINRLIYIPSLQARQQWPSLMCNFKNNFTLLDSGLVGGLRVFRDLGDFDINLSFINLLGFEPTAHLCDVLTCCSEINRTKLHTTLCHLKMKVNLNICPAYDIHTVSRNPITSVTKLHLIDDHYSLQDADRCCAALAAMFPSVEKLIVESPSEDVRNQINEFKDYFRILKSSKFRQPNAYKWFGRHRARVEADDRNSAESQAQRIVCERNQGAVARSLPAASCDQSNALDQGNLAKDKSAKHINALPDKLLCEIFKKFHLQASIALRAVCSKWKNVIEDICQKKTCFQLFVLRPETNLIPYIKSTIECAQELQITEWNLDSSDEKDVFVLQKKHFTVSCCRFLSRLFANITMFCYSSDSTQPVTLPFLLLQWLNLTYLALHNVVMYNKALLKAFAMLTSLESVNIIDGPTEARLCRKEYTLLGGEATSFDAASYSVDASLADSLLLLCVAELTSERRQTKCLVLLSTETLDASEELFENISFDYRIYRECLSITNLTNRDNAYGFANIGAQCTNLSSLTLQTPEAVLSDVLTHITAINRRKKNKNFKSLKMRINLNFRPDFNFHRIIPNFIPALNDYQLFPSDIEVSKLTELHLIDDNHGIEDVHQFCLALATIFFKLEKLTIESSDGEMLKTIEPHLSYFAHLKEANIRKLDEFKCFGRFARRVAEVMEMR